MPLIYNCESCGTTHKHTKGYIFQITLDDGTYHYFCNVNCCNKWEKQVFGNTIPEDVVKEQEETFERKALPEDWDDNGNDWMPHTDYALAAAGGQGTVQPLSPAAPAAPKKPIIRRREAIEATRRNQR